MKPFIKMFALIAIILLVSALFMVVMLRITGGNANSLAAISQFFEQHRLFFTVFRLGLLLTLYINWEKSVQWLSRKKDWDSDMETMVLQLKTRFFVWMLIFELVINQNLLSYLISGNS